MSNKYFIHTGKEKSGPFSIEELKEQNLNKDTFVWSEGFSDWKKITDVLGLEELLTDNNTPPPFRKKENTNLLRIRYALFTLLGVVIVYSFMPLLVELFNHSMKKFDPPQNINQDYPIYQPPQTYEEKKMSIEDDELQNPLRFIKVKSNFRTAIFGGNIKITGELKSKATVANYKDIVLEVQYFTQTETYLGSKQFTIFQYLRPNQSISFGEKFYSPSKTSKISVSVVSATSSNE
jgi:hypothetical protein